MADLKNCIFVTAYWTCVIGYCFYLGVASGEEEEKKVYNPEPRDPQPASKYHRQKVITTGAYEEYDLGYYAEYYDNIQYYIQSNNYPYMKSLITNSTKVCVNYDVNVNDTYLGEFICPLAAWDHEDFTSCCGLEFAEFCCYDDRWLNKEILYGGLALGGILVFVVFLGALCYIFLGGKRKL